MLWRIFSIISSKRSDAEIITYIVINYEKESGDPEKDCISLFRGNVNQSASDENEGCSKEARH